MVTRKVREKEKKCANQHKSHIYAVDAKALDIFNILQIM